MTRRALSRQEESKLQQVLLELKAAKELCSQLTLEREDNEKLVLDALDHKKKLKTELSNLHSEYTLIKEERDRFELVIQGFDQCGVEYEQALQRTSVMEKELCDAHRQITILEEASRNSAALTTQNLFEELVTADRAPGHILDAGCHIPTVTIDLTNDDSVGIVPACTKDNTSKNKLKKYVKINKYIHKTKKLIKNQKMLVNKIKNKRQKVELLDKLHMCTLQLETNKLKYETDIQLLQSELASVEESLTSITSRYEKSQEAIREYSLALDELLKLSYSNKERYDSLVANHTCDCQRSDSESPEPVGPASPALQQCVGSTTLNELNYYKTIMFSDEIGKNMGQILSMKMGHSVINNCLPDASLHEIMDLIIKYKFKTDSNLIIWLGNRGNVNKSDLIKYFDSLCTLQINKIVMFTFPYSNSLSQAENDLRYKLNMTLHTISCNNKLFHLIDSNNVVSKNYYLTQGRYYLSSFYKRQVATSLSYFFSITAKNLANQTAFIEHCPVLQNETLEITPCHLNYMTRQ